MIFSFMFSVRIMYKQRYCRMLHTDKLGEMSLVRVIHVCHALSAIYNSVHCYTCTCRDKVACPRQNQFWEIVQEPWSRSENATSRNPLQ